MILCHFERSPTVPEALGITYLKDAPMEPLHLPKQPRKITVHHSPCGIVLSGPSSSSLSLIHQYQCCYQANSPSLICQLPFPLVTISNTNYSDHSKCFRNSCKILVIRIHVAKFPRSDKASFLSNTIGCSDKTYLVKSCHGWHIRRKKCTLTFK